MSSTSPDLAHVADILGAAKLALEFAEEVGAEGFSSNLMCQSAVIRQLEIVGEATKRLSDETRGRHAEVPWRRMAGMRDVLIHGYHGIDLAEVWRTTVEELPRLIGQLDAILRTLDG